MGRVKACMEGSKDYQGYYDHVMHDIGELKKEYPFLDYHIYPTATPSEITIDVIAVHKAIIDLTCADREDFLGEYSRLINVIVPFDYRNKGCDVYGGSWIDPNRINEKDLHLYKQTKNEYGYKLCVGVPESFSGLDNVILENVRTAENILTAYDRFMKGKDKKVELLAYSHGSNGESEYARDRKRYRTKQ